jgi:hypothetical protein
MSLFFCLIIIQIGLKFWGPGDENLNGIRAVNIIRILISLYAVKNIIILAYCFG